MTQATYAQFLQYLKTDLAVSNTSYREIFVEESLQHLGRDFHLLPIVLWQYGLITLKQLEQTYE